MSTLVSMLQPGSVSNPHTRVKRPLLSNPTTVPKQLPAFRGVRNTPGDAIKAPKLSNGNRVDRGSNVVVPYARVTAMTSLEVRNGRLGPGDVAFSRKQPGGCANGTTKSRAYGANAAFANLTDMYGVDGVNKILAGSLSGVQPWRIGFNVLQESALDREKGESIDTIDPFEKLKTLQQYKLDGVVLSNEEPYSFAPTGERDATVFNMGIYGAAPVNNGFSTYNDDSGVPLYPSDRSAQAYTQAAFGFHPSNVSETWHGKVGYDFVAAFTGVYTQFPKQMFDRGVQPGDSLYLLLRRFNVEKDVVEPRIEAIRRSDSSITLDDAKTRVLRAMTFLPEADYGAALDPANLTLSECYFYQYMPCSSRALCTFKEVLKIVDPVIKAMGTMPSDAASVLYTDKRKGSCGAPMVRDKAISTEGLQKLREARTQKFTELRSTNKSIERLEKETDSVRFLDVLNFAGAWKVGHVIDQSAAAMQGVRGGPGNPTYRMTVCMNVAWMPPIKAFFASNTELATYKLDDLDFLNIDDYGKVLAAVFRKYVRSNGTYGLKKSLFKQKRSLYRQLRASTGVASFAERELALPPAFFLRRTLPPKPQLNRGNTLPLLPKPKPQLNRQNTLSRADGGAPAADLSSVPALAARPSPSVSVGATQETPVVEQQTIRAARQSAQTTTAAPTSTKASPAPTAAPTATPRAAAAGRGRAGKATAASTSGVRAAPPGVDTQLLQPTSMVDETIRASRANAKATAAPVPIAPPPVPSAPSTSAAPAKARASGGVVDDVFNTIFGPQPTAAPARSPAMAGATSPTPSSGSETGPRAFSRRSR